MKPLQHIFTRVRIFTPGLAVVVLLLLSFVVWPVKNDIVQLKNGILEVREALERQYKNGQLLKKTQRQFDAIEPDLARLEATLLRPGDEILLITALEQAAARHGLEQSISIDELPPESTDEPDEMTILPLQVELTGSFEDIVAYLAELEKFEFYINWQSVSLRSQERSSTAALLPNQIPGSAPVPPTAVGKALRAELEGETYWLTR